MEADLRRVEPDLGEACGGRPTHALSQESGITADSSASALHGDADSSAVQTIEWTDEKHNLYIDFLERSFLDQLNHSKRMHGALFQENIKCPYPALQMPKENCASSDEFKVLQDGCWQKINFQTHRMKNSSEYHVSRGPWIRHAAPAGNIYPFQSHASLQHTSVASTHICHPNLAGIIAEVTDQNFVDENGKRSYTCSPVAKRVRRSIAGGSSKDQVVPSGEFYEAGRQETLS